MRQAFTTPPLEDNLTSRKPLPERTTGNRVEPVHGTLQASAAVGRSADRGAGVSPPADGRDGLPCLYSNNSIEIEENDGCCDTLNKLSPYHKKQAEVLFSNTRNFIERHGLERVGFLTLTFRDNIRDNKKASRRFNSLNSNFLVLLFGNWMLVKERQSRGAWHYHLLVDCKADIRTGFNFDAARKQDYSSASAELRKYWQLLRKELPKYGFGRSELLPIKSNAEGMARYVGKYVSKHVGSRTAEDKGVRLFSCSKGFRVANTHFAWNSVGSWLWRMKLREFAFLNSIYRFDMLKERLGEKWAWQYAEVIEAMKLPETTVFPTLKHWQAYEELPDEACPFDIPLDMAREDRIINLVVKRIDKTRLTAQRFEISPIPSSVNVSRHSERAEPAIE